MMKGKECIHVTNSYIALHLVMHHCSILLLKIHKKPACTITGAILLVPEGISQSS